MESNILCKHIVELYGKQDRALMLCIFLFIVLWGLICSIRFKSWLEDEILNEREGDCLLTLTENALSSWPCLGALGGQQRFYSTAANFNILILK